MAKMTSGMRMMAMARARRRGDDGRFMGGNDMRYNRMEAPDMRYNRMERADMTYDRKDRPGMRYNRSEEHMPPDYEGQDPYSGETDSWPKPEKGGTYSYRRADGGEGRISYFQGHKADPLNQEKPERKPQQMGFVQRERDHEKPFDKETAMEWVEHMEDKSGVKGGAYTWHQTQQYGRNMGITGEERLIEFYAVMNAMQSDYWPAAKKFGVDKPEFYAALAKCFIEDVDAVEDKVSKYYECIASK